MEKTEKHQQVLEMISNDRSNPTYMSQLKLRTGLTRRVITDIIRDLRVNHPICSTKTAPGGYWIGRGSDIRALIADMRSSANTLNNTADNLNDILENLDSVSEYF